MLAGAVRRAGGGRCTPVLVCRKCAGRELIDGSVCAMGFQLCDAGSSIPERDHWAGSLSGWYLHQVFSFRASGFSANKAYRMWLNDAHERRTTTNDVLSTVDQATNGLLSIPIGLYLCRTIQARATGTIRVDLGRWLTKGVCAGGAVPGACHGTGSLPVIGRILGDVAGAGERGRVRAGRIGPMNFRIRPAGRMSGQKIASASGTLQLALAPPQLADPPARTASRSVGRTCNLTVEYDR